MSRVAILSDLWDRSVRDENTGCLRWTGAHTPKGYGQIRLDGKAKAVHRVAYDITNGAIPNGYEVDHVYTKGCRYRDCIEPSHLEAITHAENVARQVATVTHCKKGHEFTEENTYRRKNDRGYSLRQCRICKRESNRKGRLK